MPDDTPEYPGFTNPFDFQNGSSSPTVVGAVDNQVAPYNTPDTGSWASKLFPNGVSGDDFANLGKAALGIYGATRTLPTDSKSAAWNAYLQKMQALSGQGLTPEEYSLANRNNQNAYASDLEAIRQGTGGNASTYLGNAGRAINSLYNAKGELAATDANLHRNNLLQYGNVLGQDNALNRTLFLDKYNQDLESKKAGAALASDALYNIHNKDMFNKQYGSGSLYQKWLQSQIDNTTAKNDALGQNNSAFSKYLGITSPTVNTGAYQATDATVPSVPIAPAENIPNMTTPSVLAPQTQSFDPYLLNYIQNGGN